jgi:microcystin-dependent protein
VSNATLSHDFVSAKADAADATLIRPGNWNAPHKWSGGSDKDIQIRDTGSPDGASWMGIDATLSITGATGARVLGAVPLPSGTVAPFAGATAPDGWLLCDGSAVSRTTYSTLFGVLGTTYGLGDGVSTFNLPDARGRTLIGAGTGSGLTFRALGALGGQESDIHDHVVSGNTSVDVGASGANSNDANAGPTPATAGHWHTLSLATTSASVSNMPPFLVVNYIIKI